MFERTQDNPVVLQWSSCSSSMLIEDCIHAGELITIDRHTSTPLTELYVLTKSCLIKSAAHSFANPVSAAAMLRLRNPRLAKIERPSAGLYVSLTDSCGFVLEAYRSYKEFYCRSKEDRTKWVEGLRQVCILAGVRKKYYIKGSLGKGNFGVVSLGVRKSDGKEFAIKTISKKISLKKLKKIDSLVNEINLLRLMDHPKVIKLYEVYESNRHLFLIMEYARKGDLLSHLKAKGTYSEREASLLVMQTLEVLDYCHSLNIVHRDLKLDNLMIQYFLLTRSESHSQSTLKLIDFGFAAAIAPGTTERLMCGSPGFVAPEVYTQEGYDCKADVFSLGVVLYTV